MLSGRFLEMMLGGPQDGSHLIELRERQGTYSRNRARSAQGSEKCRMQDPGLATSPDAEGSRALGGAAHWPTRCAPG